ncbi:MAG TPA: M28 family peptidase, partial [Kofleriaceae bacterium]
MKHAALACALFACGGDDAMMTGGPDAGSMGSGDGSVVTDDSGNICTKPALDQPWLADLVSGAVSSLAAAPRANSEQRQAARTYLQSQLTQIGWTPLLHNYNTGANVYATIPATSGATKQIIVGAHFDTVSISPGANDNGTGSAAVLAVARYLKDVTCRKYAVTIVFFDEEEAGLFGARAFANTLQLANVQA